MTTRKKLKVLVMEPANQHLPYETARPNGSLGPAYLVGALRARGIEADYLDAAVGCDRLALQETFFRRVDQENGNVRCGMSQAQLAEIVAGYDIVATSSIFTVQTRMHFEVASIAKKVSKENNHPILVISGGVNARALREHFLSNCFDVVALGEGEQTIVDIVDQYSRNNPDFSQVDGIAYRSGGITVTRPPRRIQLGKYIDDLPVPALDALPLDIYRDLGIPHSGRSAPGRTFAAIQTARGCQDKCTFCHISLEKLQPELVGGVGQLRMFSNERVGEDVKRAVDLGVQRLYFEDDNLFFNKRRLTELAPYLKHDGLDYSDVNGANLRFLVKQEKSGSYTIDNEFIELLAGFGLRELSLPYETRSREMMKKYASGKYDPVVMDPIGIAKAVKKAGIRPTANMMIGFRDESWESILQTKEFAKELIDAGLDSVGFAIPVPYPGTVDFETLMQDSVLRADFDQNVLAYTDSMHTRGRPLFPTAVPSERLVAAVRDFWYEINDSSYTSNKDALASSPTS